MDRVIEYKDLSGDYILVDVRSPSEYCESHIHGAVNVPLFDDEERKIIGTVYKHESKLEAKKLGIEYTSKKLPQIFNEILLFKKTYNKVILYCARGGMRSGAICALFNSLGQVVWQLKGGYKEYRQYVIKRLTENNKDINYIVLHGHTGVGKTLILNELEQLEFDVLDLERAANHRGSLLGKVGLSKVIGQKQFETILFEQIKNRKSNFVFVEAESSKIGNVYIPQYIKEKMNNGLNILVESDIEVRAKRIVDEYTMSSTANEEIIQSLNKLKKLLGTKVVDNIISLVKNQNYIDAAKILMSNYYDPLYNHSQKKYKYDCVINSDNIEAACGQIIYFVRDKMQ